MIGAAVIVDVLSCEAGWINFAVSAGPARVAIAASHLFDPFPDMVDWLAAIVGGKADCPWRIDQEGRHAIVALNVTPEGTRLRIVSEEPGQISVLMDAPVDSAQCAAAFVAAFRTFAASPRYRSEEWEHVTLHRAFEQAFPGVPTRELCRLSAGDLALVFDALSAGHRPPEGGRQLDAFLQWGLANLTPPWECLGGYPVGEGEVPAEWDRWGEDERRQCLRQLLDLGTTRNWNGSPLPDLLRDPRLAMRPEAD